MGLGGCGDAGEGEGPIALPAETISGADSCDPSYVVFLFVDVVEALVLVVLE
jgi:hypothetical protein